MPRPLLACLFALAIWPGGAAREKQEEPPTAEHEDAMRRAQVWLEPTVPIEQASPGENPPGPDSFAPDQEVVCSFRPGYMGDC